MELIAKDRLNNDELFIDTTDTPKEVIEEHAKKKKKCLKGALRIGKGYLLGIKKKWTQKTVSTASYGTINKLYTKYR